MYFTADVGDGFHVWRQRDPDSQPEQVTSEPSEEQGLAVAHDGKSLMTSVGLTQRSVWLRDASGERQLSLEGYAFWPLLSADGRKVLFRVTRSAGSGQSPSELWMTERGSDQKRRLFPNQAVTSYDVSRDDRVAAAVVEPDGKTGIWVAWLDGREPPRRIPHADGDNPRFGRNGEIIFRVHEGQAGALDRIRENGEGRERIGPVSSHVFGGVSPDGKWLSGVDRNSQHVLHSLTGEPSRRLFASSQTARLRWTLDGTRAYLSIQYGQASGFATGRTYILPLTAGSSVHTAAA